MSENTIFVVRMREEWELKPFWSGVWYYRAPKKGGVVRAFTSEKRARAFHRRLEEHTRTKLPKVNPFKLCRSWEMNYEVVTSLPEFALFDWLRDVGLEPPEPFRPRWHTKPNTTEIDVEWYREAGIELPELGSPAWNSNPHSRLVSSDWHAWWEKHVKTMTEEQIDHVWRGLDRVKFYEVVSVPLG